MMKDNNYLVTRNGPDNSSFIDPDTRLLRFTAQTRKDTTKDSHGNVISIKDTILDKIKQVDIPSWQKFEWNCKKGERNIWKYIIQFRASGIRLKQPTFAPSLVCTPTQVPIIGWRKRYISRKEGARLQSISGIELPKNNNICFHALGNAVNVHIAYLIAKALLK
jgi:DNA (cytosine-5)-methyltransferase 1